MISVVIPLFNKEKSIRTTLESVLAQSYTDYEVIVVDDGSTDNSSAVVESIISKCQISNVQCPIRLFYKPNGGVSSARNFGIEKSSGDYAAFLDGDDLWDKDFLKEMAQLIQDYPGKSIYGLGCAQIVGNEISAEKGNSYYRGITEWNWNTMAYTGSSACVSKKDAIEVGLFDMRMTHGEDVDMWWRLLLKNGGACYTKPYAYYRQDAENRATHKNIPLEKFIPYYIDKYEEARAKNKEFRKFFDQEMIYRLYLCLFDKHYRKEARRLAAKLDYSQLKFSMRFRMICPHLYRLLSGK